jgi:hypothetical protein
MRPQAPSEHPQGATAQIPGPAIRFISVNARRAAQKLNAGMVNGDSGVLKLPVFWQKNAV